MEVWEVRPHKEGCSALSHVASNDWKHPLFMSFREVQYRDSIGRLHRHGQRCVVAVCNSVQCDGRWIVPVDEIELAVWKAIKKAHATKTLPTATETPNTRTVTPATSLFNTEQK